MDGFQLPHRTFTAAGNCTLLATDCVVTFKKGTGAAFNVQLPPLCADGTVFIGIDEKGDANTNNITWLPDTTVGSDTILGASTYVQNVAKSSTRVLYDAAQKNWVLF